MYENILCDATDMFCCFVILHVHKMWWYIFLPKISFILFLDGTVWTWHILIFHISHFSNADVTWESRDIFFLSFFKIQIWLYHFCLICPYLFLGLQCLCTWCHLQGMLDLIFFLILFCMVLFTSTVYISGWYQAISKSCM